MTANIQKPAPVYSATKTPEGFAIEADGVTIKTPAGNDFILPAEKLAHIVADEWRAQKDNIVPASMPLTQLTATTIDITRNNREKVIDELMKYIGSELLCHRAEEPEALRQKQNEAWQPVLDWCARQFDISLQTGSGIMPIAQSAQAEQALRRAIENYDDFRLTILRHAADVSGSLILALALTERHLTPEQIFELSELDALFQMEKWGADEETIKRHEAMKRDLAVCALAARKCCK